MKEKISTKNTWVRQMSLALLLFVFVLSIALYQHIRYKNNLISQWQQQLNNTLELVSANLENYLDKFYTSALFLTKQPEVIQMIEKPEKQNKELIHILNQYVEVFENEIHGIQIRDSLYQLLYATPEQYEPGHKFFAQQAEKWFNGDVPSAFCTDIVKGNHGQHYFYVVLPAFTKNHLLGYLTLALNMEYIQSRYIESVRTGYNGYLWLIDNQNIIRSHHHKTFNGLDLDFIMYDYEVTGKVKGYNRKKSEAYLRETRQFFEAFSTRNNAMGNIIDFAHNQYSMAQFKKIHFLNTHLIIIASIPYSEITGPVIQNALLIFGLTFSFTAILAWIVVNIYLTNRREKELYKESMYLKSLAEKAEEIRQEKENRLRIQLEAQENERSRISRELHDGLGQYLLAAKIKMNEWVNQLDPDQKEKSKEIVHLLNESIEEVKKTSNNLMPRILDSLQLPQAVSWLCQDVSKTTGIKVDFVTYGLNQPLSSRIKIHLYRIIQESIQNAIKHANATEIDVQLLSSNEQISLLISDNGKGFQFNHETLMQGNGISNMKDRTALLGGTIHIHSTPGKGTEIIVKIPIVSENEKN